jgi:predicted nucleotidyltransferase
MGTAAAYAEALRASVDVPLPNGFPSSNDLLGIAYLSALKRVSAEEHILPSPHAITRLGSGYREDTLTEGQYPSATALRLLLREAACDPVALEAMLEGTMPRASLDVLLRAVSAGTVPTDSGRLLSFYHALYRVRSPEACKDTAEWNGGLAGHISRTARETATPEAFFEALRTKQYTDARLRRALLFGALEVTDEDVKAWPSYTTLLAANLRGRAYLKEWKRQSKNDGHGFRVVTKPADAPEGRQRDLSESADALFTLCLPRPADAGALLRRGPCLYP